MLWTTTEEALKLLDKFEKCSGGAFSWRVVVSMTKRQSRSWLAMDWQRNDAAVMRGVGLSVGDFRYYPTSYPDFQRVT